MNGLDRYYEILGLKHGASGDEVKQAYRDLVKVWHPDRYSHDPRLQVKAQEKLKEINEAYAKLNTLRFTSSTAPHQSEPDSQQSRPNQEKTTCQSKESGVIERFHLIGLSKLGQVMLGWGVFRATTGFFLDPTKSSLPDFLSIGLGGVLVGFVWFLSPKTRWLKVWNWVGLVYSIMVIAILIGLIVWAGRNTNMDVRMQRALVQTAYEWFEIGFAWGVAEVVILVLGKQRMTSQRNKKTNVGG